MESNGKHKWKPLPDYAMSLAFFIEDMGLSTCEPKTINRLLTFAHEYVTTAISDLKDFALKIGKGVGERDILKIVIQRELRKIIRSQPSSPKLFKDDLTNEKSGPTVNLEISPGPSTAKSEMSTKFLQEGPHKEKEKASMGPSTPLADVQQVKSIGEENGKASLISEDSALKENKKISGLFTEKVVPRPLPDVQQKPMGELSQENGKASLMSEGSALKKNRKVRGFLIEKVVRRLLTDVQQKPKTKECSPMEKEKTSSGPFTPLSKIRIKRNTELFEEDPLKENKKAKRRVTWEIAPATDVPEKPITEHSEDALKNKKNAEKWFTWKVAPNTCASPCRVRLQRCQVTQHTSEPICDPGPKLAPSCTKRCNIGQKRKDEPCDEEVRTIENFKTPTKLEVSQDKPFTSIRLKPKTELSEAGAAKGRKAKRRSTWKVEPGPLSDQDNLEDGALKECGKAKQKVPPRSSPRLSNLKPKPELFSERAVINNKIDEQPFTWKIVSNSRTATLKLRLQRFRKDVPKDLKPQSLSEPNCDKRYETVRRCAPSCKVPLKSKRDPLKEDILRKIFRSRPLKYKCYTRREPGSCCKQPCNVRQMLKPELTTNPKPEKKVLREVKIEPFDWSHLTMVVSPPFCPLDSPLTGFTPPGDSNAALSDVGEDTNRSYRNPFFRPTPAPSRKNLKRKHPDSHDQNRV